ncbi:MAG: DUF7577 domain-containing protein [Halanaerobiaceae bacterium]
MNEKKLTSGGIALLVIGGIMVLIGLILFFSVFISVFNFVGNGFNQGPGVSQPGFDSGPDIPFVRAVFGVILAGGGTLLFKVGLGMSVLGKSDSIARWIGDKIKTGKASSKKASSGKANFCPDCGTENDFGSRYCKSCGREL